jgi:hypothetical protein
MKLNADILAAAAEVKTARLVKVEDTNSNAKLQRMVGDPDDVAISPFSQTKPNPGNMLLPNPLSPVAGDEIFYSYLIPGARFQAQDGSWWDIESYDWEGAISIVNAWYPRIRAVVSIQAIRRSIHSYIEPITVIVPPPPVGADYGVIETRQVK